MYLDVQGQWSLYIAVGKYLLCICERVLGCEHVIMEECACLHMGIIFMCMYV